MGPGDGLRPMYVNAKSNHKCNLELIDLLKEVLFHLIRCLTWIDRSFNLWSEKLWYNQSIAIDERYLKGHYPNI